METIEEVAAVTKAKAGDHQAFGALVSLHCQVVFRVIFRIVGDEADAEEITQEVFLRAFRKLNDYRSESSFRTWLVAIATNTAYNFVLKRRHDPVHNADSISYRDESLTWSHHFVERRASPEQLVIEKERMHKRIQAMSRLTPMERTAFLLRHSEGTPLSEIAIVLGVSINSVKHAIFRAVSKLRRELSPCPEEVR